MQGKTGQGWQPGKTGTQEWIENMSQKKRKYRPRPSGIHALARVWRMKGTSTEDEQLVIAEKAFEYLDNMKTHPDLHGYIQLIDILNILTVAIRNTTTPEECKANQCVNLHEWLTEIGHDNVAKKINDASTMLLKAGERIRRTGSYALDGATYEIMEQVIQMYHQVYNVAPRGFMKDVITYCQGVHKPQPNGKIKLTHLSLSDYYEDTENGWEFDAAA